MGQWLATIALSVIAQTSAALAEESTPIRIELNAIETVQSEKPGTAARCRLTFVVENKAEAIGSLKLDLAVFGREGAIQRRIIAEMGPVRKAKTIVKAFEVEGIGCDALGSVLVNDVTACQPDEPSACLERLTLASRQPAVRLFK